MAESDDGAMNGGTAIASHRHRQLDGHPEEMKCANEARWREAE